MKKIHINLDKDTKLWFTSDIHFGHRNVIKFCNRPYESDKDMNISIIKNWNSVVNENDIVFVLGDTFWFNHSKTIRKFLNQLNGNIYMLPGNHDEFDKFYPAVCDNPKITLCDDITCLFLTLEDSGKIYELWLSHYPLMTWPHRVNGSINFFGHIHSKPDGRDGVDQDLPLHKNQCDVGCDYWGMKPVLFETLLEKIS